MPPRHCLRTAPAIAMLLAVTLRADTIHLHPPAAIQAAIDAAVDGDVLIAHPGTYVGPVNFRGKAITLRSAGGAAVTTLDGQFAATVVQCVAGESPATILDGFTITRGRTTSNGGGLLVLGAAPTVLNCVFRENDAAYGGAVFMQAAQPTLHGCGFEQNVAAQSGGGLYFFGPPGMPAGVVDDCWFIDNRAGAAGGAVRVWDVRPSFVRCRFELNHARQQGGAVANGGAAAATFERCIFDGNRTDTLFGSWDAYGGGMSNFESSRPILTSCVFVRNHAVALLPRLSYGGAVASGASAVARLEHCTLVDNYANIGRGVCVLGGANVAITGAIFWNGGNDVAVLDVSFVSIAYSNVPGGFPGPGNLNVDPELDGLRLSSESRCIDAGDPAFASPVARDLDGHARVLRGRVDMGAYEFGIGDVNSDGVVDAQDFIAGATCFTGPDAGPYTPGCERLDFEYDGDVDLLDLAALQPTVSG